MSSSKVAMTSGQKRQESVYANVAGQKPEESLYANVATGDGSVQKLADEFGNLMINSAGKPRPAERGGQAVSMSREDRVKEVNPTGVKAEAETEVDGRAPVGATKSDQHVQENLHMYANVWNQGFIDSGQKRGHGEQIYHHIPVDPQDMRKALRPTTDPLELQRLGMLHRNEMYPRPGFRLPNRQPVESADPTHVYYNVHPAHQPNHNAHYVNIRQREPPFATSAADKTPCATPRTNATQNVMNSQSLPFLTAADTEAVLSGASTTCTEQSHTYANLPLYYLQPMPPPVTSAPTVMPMRGHPTSSQSHPTSSQSHPTSSQSHTSGHSQSPSPQASHQLVSPAASQGYPPSLSPCGSQGYAQSPKSQQSYSHSPPTPYSQPNTPAQQPFFSPPHPGSYTNANPQSYPSDSSAGQLVYGSSSPSSSQHVPSPCSYSSTEVGSPEMSLYNNIDPKLNFDDTEHTRSLTEDLKSLNNTDMENFQHLHPYYPTGPTNGSAHPCNANIQQQPIYSFEQPYPHGAPAPSHGAPTPSHYEPFAPHNLNTPMPLSTNVGMVQSTGGAMVSKVLTVIPPNSGSRHMGSATPAMSAPDGKMLLPPFPKPTKPAAAQQPTIVVFLPAQPQVKQYPKLAPRPPAEGEVVKDIKEAKAKAKPKSGKAKKSAESKAGAARRNPDIQAKVMDPKDIIANTPDAQLLELKNGETVLHTAIVVKNQSFILKLFAAMKNRPSLQQLIEKANSREQTPLFLSVIMGQTWLTDVLVKMNANCDTLCRLESGDGLVEYVSTLHYASRYGDRYLKELRSILLSRSTSVNSHCRSGMTPLHQALWYHGQPDPKTKKAINSQNVIHLLRNNGAQCYIADIKGGRTALHVAVETGSLDLTRLVLSSSNNVDNLIDMQDYDGRTALHTAISLSSISEENKVDLVKYLISAGANKSSKDKKSRTPKDLVDSSQLKMLEVFGDGNPASAFSTHEEISYPI